MALLLIEFIRIECTNQKPFYKMRGSFKSDSFY